MCTISISAVSIVWQLHFNLYQIRIQMIFTIALLQISFSFFCLLVSNTMNNFLMQPILSLQIQSFISTEYFFHQQSKHQVLWK